MKFLSEIPQSIVYWVAVVSLLLSAFVVFRIIVRNDYARRGQLTLLASFLELLICLAYASIPYIYNPPCWPYIWNCKTHSPPLIAVLGYFITCTGVCLGFGSMFWLGIPRSFGRQATGLYCTGPYRLSRNPQVLGGFLMASGIALLWPSWYALGWVILWMAMFHLMVLSEEEHLHEVFGEEYSHYCEKAPRYLGKVRST